MKYYAFRIPTTGKYELKLNFYNFTDSFYPLVYLKNNDLSA